MCDGSLIVECPSPFSRLFKLSMVALEFMRNREKDLIHTIFSQNMLICIFNGFAAGLPLYYLIQLVPAWLRSEGVDLKTIGLFALIGMPYTWKFIWSPLMDRFTLPFLGRRRGWMLITQVALMFSMFTFSWLDPKISIWLVVYTSMALAFFSASQDIVLDAYRRELLPDKELGLGNSMYMNGYRAASFVPGGLGLILADYISWSAVHITIGLFMAVGIVKTLLIQEVAQKINPPKTIKEAVIEPFREFFKREGVKSAFLVLAFMFLYKLGDNLATALSTPFYLDMGFSKTVIGLVVKNVGLCSTIVGAFVGGSIIFKIGINRSLWIFGGVQMLSILGFAVLAANPQGLSLLGLQLSGVVLLGFVVAFEYLGVGLGASAMVAFMARASHANFTATQFALFSSIIALPRTFANATTGFLIEGITPEDGMYFEIFGAFEGMGYIKFFYFCTAGAIPGMILLFWVAPWGEKSKSTYG